MTGSARLALACSVGNFAGWASRVSGRGRGETLRGRVTLTLDPNAISKLGIGRDVVLVSGTNGKTTTTSHLVRILEEGTGEAVSTSRFGANMTAGIVAALSAKPRNRLVVLECDELYLPAMYRDLKPKVIALLNLSRDQLHRTGEVRKVANLWHNTFTSDDVTLVIDRDDPFLEFAAGQAGHVLRVTFGGRRHPDAATCPQCASLLDWSLGDYKCPCGLGSALAQVRGDQRLRGPARNAVLAIEAARLMGAVVPVDLATELTENAPDRVSNFDIHGTVIPTRLAKNPESWREALTQVASPDVILSVNARGIDGRDTSWLWDIDYSALIGRRVICTGDRRLDVAYRVSVQGVADVQVAENFEAALALTDGRGEQGQHSTRTVEAIASYTAFQELSAQELGIHARQGGRP